VQWTYLVSPFNCAASGFQKSLAVFWGQVSPGNQLQKHSSSEAEKVNETLLALSGEFPQRLGENPQICAFRFSIRLFCFQIFQI